MPKFNYVLVDDAGQKIKGSLSASNKSEAIDSLRLDGKVILSVEENYSGKFWIWSKPTMSIQEKMLFVSNLATMLRVGITIVDSLEIIISQTKKKKLIAMYQDIMDRLSTGESLSDALSNYENIFSGLFLGMIRTGERSGNLPEVMDYLSIQLSKEYELRRKIVSAMVYPLVIMSLTLTLAIALVVFVMPKITEIFDKFDVELPLPTRMLIGLSNFLIENTLLTISMAVIVVILLIAMFKSEILKPMWQRIFLRVPIFGKVMIYANVARFARSFNSLLQAGLPVVESLRIIADMMNVVVYKNLVEEVADKIEKGGKLGDGFAVNERLFPILVSKLLTIGESTGTLELTSGRIATLYEKDVDAKTKNMSVLMEPVLLVLMSGLVGGIALSIILPIYQLPNLLGQ